MKKGMMFKFFLVLIFMCALLSVALGAGMYLYSRISKIEGNSNLVTKEYEIENIKEITINLPAKVEIIEKKQDDKVEIRIEENLVDEISVDQDENLKISRKVSLPLLFPRIVEYNRPIEIKIYVDTFEKITLSDSTEAFLSEQSKPLTAEKLEINLSGSSKLNFRMSTDELKLNLSGSSELQLIGYTEELEANLSGSSSLVGRDLESEKVKINMSGSSKANIYVKQELDAKLSGSSLLEYGGDPSKLKQDVDNESRITEI